MRFQVRTENTYRTVNVIFGDENDVRSVSRWRAPKGLSPAVRDAVEFARLASKRWRYYRRSISSARSLSELITSTVPSNQNEVSLILIAKADWFSALQPLGLAQCRRTFCNHLILEFLSVHPKILAGRVPSIRGTGSGLIYTLAAVAEVAGIRRIWGEATAHSSPFYRNIFEDAGIKDLFFAGPDVVDRCALKFRSDVKGELDI